MKTFRITVWSLAIAASLALFPWGVLTVDAQTTPATQLQQIRQDLGPTSTPAVLAPSTVAVDTSASTQPVTADTAVVVEDANKITIPVASWIDQVAVVVRDVGTAALPLLITFILTLVPAPIRMIAGPFLQKYANGILDRALDYGINAVKGATKDKPLTIPTGNAVIAHASQYLIDHAPGWLTKTLGGEDGIRQKIFARLNLPVDAGIEDFNQVIPASGTTKPAKTVVPQIRSRYPLTH